jgi:hypothetical protein
MSKPTIDDFDETNLFAAPKPASGNPLAKYFRSPGLMVSLPTGGAFLPPGSYNPTMSGEVGVLPMRAADELLMKSPDALMSGYAVEQMLLSCVPSIIAPREVSAPDLDVLLLAVRAASYGNDMDIDTHCPACKAEATFSCHLPALLGNVQPIPAENPVRLSADVVVLMRPHNLQNATTIGLAAFEETRKLQALEDADEEARTAAINASMKRMSDLNIKVLADCVLKVATPEGIVTDRASIFEFVANIGRDWVKRMDDKLKELNHMGLDKGIDVTCPTCQHEWRATVEFDPTSFFALGS